MVQFEAWHGKTLAEHEALRNQWEPQGYRFVSLSIYGAVSAPVFAAVMVRQANPVAQRDFPVMTAAQWQQTFDPTRGSRRSRSRAIRRRMGIRRGIRHQGHPIRLVPGLACRDDHGQGPAQHRSRPIPHVRDAAALTEPAPVPCRWPPYRKSSFLAERSVVILRPPLSRLQGTGTHSSISSWRR